MDPIIQKRIDSALIGYGYWGKILEKYIRKNSFFNLLCIGQHRIEKDLLSKIMYDSNIRAVFICTPIDSHYELCMTALMSGKHIFCEKPLSKNIYEIKKLKDTANESHLALFTDYIYCFSPSINQLRLHINEIGRIYTIKCSITQWGNFYPNDGVLDVLGVHIVSVLLFVLPNILINKIKTLSKIFDDNGQLVEFIGGLYTENCNIEIHASLISQNKTRLFEFFGEFGSITIDLLSNNTFMLKKNNQATISMAYDEKNNISSVLNHFISSIDNGHNNCDFAYQVASVVKQIKDNI